MRLSQKLLQEAKDSYKCWYTLNESYSVQKLTFETDRLPAVSGVASTIQETVAPHIKYCAGLWRENMLNDLCWSVDYTVASSSVPEVLPERFIAPS
jgi:hypothetical protein